MAQIDILMATYNGEAFIPQQIDSLIHQTFTDWKLIIHDDASTDRTTDIIKSYAHDKRIVLLEDGIALHNPAKNFLHTLKHSDAPFAIFCDQDDIWLDKKLEYSYQYISEQDNNKPQVVYSNAYVYDSQASTISGSAILNFPKNLESLFFLNGGILGCTMMINDKLRKICCDTPDFVSMHDQLVMISALTFGEAHYLNKHLMLYRRYTGSVTGTKEASKMDHALFFFQKGKTVLSKIDYEAIKSFYQHHEQAIDPSRKIVFKRLFNFEKHGRIINFFRVWRYGFNIFNKRSILSLKILLRRLQ